jgi:hypothetical protein
VGLDAGLRRGVVREGRARRRAHGGDRGLRCPLDGGEGLRLDQLPPQRSDGDRGQGQARFGDLDPSGVDAARDIEAKLRRYAPGAEIHFERPAITRAQVEEWNLPTRPTKQTDTRAKKFGSATSVELDAIPAHQLRGLVCECIERHIDQEQLNILKVAEESERGFLKSVAAIHAGGKP